MKRILPFFLLAAAPFALAASQANAASDMACAQVIQKAQNATTGECRDFSTPCDVPTGWNAVTECKTDDDTQIEKLETEAQARNVGNEFQLKKFSSCDTLETELKKFIKTYHSIYPNYGMYRGGIDVMYMADGVAGAPAPTMEKSANMVGTTSDAAMPTQAMDYSKTNVQVKGVDEPEIVKTDGSKVYYYNSEKRVVSILQAYPAFKMKLIRNIKVPSNFGSVDLFLSGNKLVILGTKYSNEAGAPGMYWFNRSTKTVAIVYDVKDPSNLKIDRYYQVDGAVSQSRVIGSKLYFLSTADFSFPYETYYPMAKSGVATMDEKKFDTDFKKSKVLPIKTELRRTSVTSEQNYRSNGRKYPYNLSSVQGSRCEDIEYVLPNEETLKKNQFTPNFVTLSAIELSEAVTPVQSKVMFGDVREIHMSQKNLYITSNLYTATPFRCGSWYRCFMPWYNSGEQTLIHKLSLNGLTAKYQSSAIVPGNPLSQYSMDEDANGNFRLVTVRNDGKEDVAVPVASDAKMTVSMPPPPINNNVKSSNLYVLDSGLNPIGKLEGLGKGENFQSSRFIGNRLYLVTFKQIDPLFVIDIKDPKHPAVLGELKIPGYSTYLHPYDETHLIGLGYDTTETSYGATRNAGIKVDLYDVADVKNPKQQATLGFGDQGSSSDALNNPRMFTWDASKKLLYLPALLFTSAKDAQDTYRHSNAWQGTLVIGVDTASGIKEKARITHLEAKDLEAKRTKDCAQYTQKTEKTCHALIGGGEYCTDGRSGYVPQYCYANSPIGEFFANQIWTMSTSFIQRNLFLDNWIYTISNDRVQANDIGNGYGTIGSIKF